MHRYMITIACTPFYFLFLQAKHEDDLWLFMLALLTKTLFAWSHPYWIIER
ncbi:hypothetical protein VAE115_320868 [Vibrio aestuarianus]|nr:hypothetical protein VAEU17_230167 [Vibrio aestuarianus]CAH8202778.1 hypothetical protein VAE128_460873 [Vibrio aestuarianus]CAH8203380.1 hypothetical protein VAE115_320868 [Vibrio aestuarianus]